MRANHSGDVFGAQAFGCLPEGFLQELLDSNVFLERFEIEPRMFLQVLPRFAGSLACDHNRRDVKWIGALSPVEPGQ